MKLFPPNIRITVGHVRFGALHLHVLPSAVDAKTLRHWIIGTIMLHRLLYHDSRSFDMLGL